jgi:hypothetical protein
VRSLASRRNPVRDIIDVLEHAGRWNPMHEHALGAKPAVATCVVGDVRRIAMPVAIDFDAKPSRRTEEVEDIVSHRVLSLEDRFCGRTTTQPRPQHHLWFGHHASQNSGALAGENACPHGAGAAAGARNWRV